MIEREQGFVSVVIAGLLGLLFIGASIFGFIAYSGKQDIQNNLDAKVADAVELAVVQAETAKDAEFVEKEKEPFKTYQGSATYGSISFQYPKTWSVYVVEAAAGTVIDLYAHPGFVPGVGTQKLYALRMQITSIPYDQEVKQLDSILSLGKTKAEAFRPDKVSGVLGLKATGDIISGNQGLPTQGSMVLMPLRDRTIKLSTESQEFIKDFNNIILPTFTFVP